MGICGPKGVKFKFGFSDQVHFSDDGGRRDHIAAEGEMPTASPKIPPLPAFRMCRSVMKDGKINTDWYRWLVTFVSIMTKVRSEIP